MKKRIVGIIILLLFLSLSYTVYAEDNGEKSAQLKSITIGVKQSEANYKDFNKVFPIALMKWEYFEAELQDNNIFYIDASKWTVNKRFLYITGERVSKTAEVTIKDLSDPDNNRNKNYEIDTESNLGYIKNGVQPENPFITTGYGDRNANADEKQDATLEMHLGTACFQIDVKDGEEKNTYYLVIDSRKAERNSSGTEIGYNVESVKFLNGQTKEILENDIQPANPYYAQMTLPDNIFSIRLNMSRLVGEMEKQYSESNIIAPNVPKDYYDSFYRKDSNYVSINGGEWTRLDGDGKGYSQELILKQGMNIVQIRGCADTEWKLGGDSHYAIYGNSVFFIYREGKNTYIGMKDENTELSKDISVYRATDVHFGNTGYSTLAGKKFEIQNSDGIRYIECSTGEKMICLDVTPKNTKLKVAIADSTSNIGGKYLIKIDPEKYNEATPIEIQLLNDKGDVVLEQQIYIHWSAGDATLSKVELENGSLDQEFCKTNKTYLLNTDSDEVGIKFTPNENVTITSVLVGKQQKLSLNSSGEPIGVTEPISVTASKKDETVEVEVSSGQGDLTTTAKYTFQFPAENQEILESSKKQAETILKKSIDAMSTELGKTANDSWYVFMLASAGVSMDDYNVNDIETNKYTQATTWARNILQLIIQGENPYDYKIKGMNLVEGLLNEQNKYSKGGFGPYANNIWALMALDAVGVDFDGKDILINTVISQAMSSTFDLDMRGWALLASVPHRNEPGMEAKILTAMRSIRNERQIQSNDPTWSKYKGSFKHLLYRNINANTHGCVVSGLVAAGTDPGSDYWTIDGQSPIDILDMFQIKDGKNAGKFYWKTDDSDGNTFDSSGIGFNKDAIIALGDIVNGSNIWNRLVLTADKVDALINQAEQLKIKGTEAQQKDLQEKIDAAKAAYQSGNNYGESYYALLASMDKIDDSIKPNARMCTKEENEKVIAIMDAIEKLKESKAPTMDEVNKIRADYKALNSEKLQGYIRNYSSLDEIEATAKVEAFKALKPELNASIASVTSIKLTWKKVDGAQGYKVYRSESEKGNYVEITDIKNGNSTTWSDSNLTTGKTYYYKLTAYQADIVSADSNVVSVKPVAEQQNILKATTVKATVVSYNQVKLTWKKVAGAESYKIYRSTSKSSGYKNVKTVKTLTWTDSKLTTGKTYYYKVEATAKNAKSSTSKVVSAKPVLSVPSSVKVTSSSYNKTTVTWKKVTGATSYKVYRATSKKGTYKKVATVKTLKWTDSKLKTGKTYYYKVRSYNKTANSGYSKVVSAKPVPAKTNLSSVKNVKGKKATLTWKKVDGATGYKVYRATKKNGNYTSVKTVKNVKTWTDSKLTKDKTYYYKVRAYKTVDGSKVYGVYSDVKQVVVRK